MIPYSYIHYFRAYSIVLTENEAKICNITYVFYIMYNRIVLYIILISTLCIIEKGKKKGRAEALPILSYAI